MSGDRLVEQGQQLDWPLMQNNIVREDLDALIEFLQQDDPILTQSANVRAFEQEWADWVGVKHCVFVNSGASANLVTMKAIAHHYGPGEVIVPTLTWISDVASVLQAGLDPVFVDIDDRTLGMDEDQVLDSITENTRAVFLTHVLGYNGLSQRLLDELEARNIPLIEDVCESHGATFEGKKLGSLGFASNFSFYYAHHLSTIEGGMVCTNDWDFFQTVRMLRSHGMLREVTCDKIKQQYWDEYPECNPEFVFTHAAFNVRSTELNAVVGRNQLKRLDDNNAKRTSNLKLFLDHLDPAKFRTDFAFEGSCNYAFTLVLNEADDVLCENVMNAMKTHGIEYRRGLSGGGNQLRQPYIRERVGKDFAAKFPKVEHVHDYGFYIGNYPCLDASKITKLCDLLNAQQTAEEAAKAAA